MSTAALEKPTSFRPSRELKKAVESFRKQAHKTSFSEAVCELLEEGLRSKRQQDLASEPRKALHEAMMLLFPDWSGKIPDFGKPVKIALKGGRDPIGLLLARRAKAKG